MFSSLAQSAHRSENFMDREAQLPTKRPFYKILSICAAETLSSSRKIALLARRGAGGARNSGRNISRRVWESERCRGRARTRPGLNGAANSACTREREFLSAIDANHNSLGSRKMLSAATCGVSLFVDTLDFILMPFECEYALVIASTLWGMPETRICSSGGIETFGVERTELISTFGKYH